MDRLILELKLPPTDAYYKLKHVIEESEHRHREHHPWPGRVEAGEPEKGNVLFACTGMGWCFTLASFAKMYSDSYGGVNINEFAQTPMG